MTSFLNLTKKILLFSLIGSIVLIPSFKIGEIPAEGYGHLRNFELHLEDIILVCFLSVFLFILLKKKNDLTFEHPPFLKQITLWLIFGLISLVVNFALGGLRPLTAALFYLKEAEFFFLFYAVFYALTEYKQAQWLMRVWIFFGLLSTLWILILLFFPITNWIYYGPLLLSEPTNPFASGVIFLIIFLFMLNMYLFHYLPTCSSLFKKTALGLLMLSPAIGVFGSGSMTAGGGIVIGFAITCFLYIIKTKKIQSLAPLLIIIFFAAFVLSTALFFNTNHSSPIQRQLRVNKKIVYELNAAEPNSRLNIWTHQIGTLYESPLAALIGYGKSRFGESHNMFVKAYVETGLIGFLFFVFLFASIITYAGKSFFQETVSWNVAVAAGLFTMSLTMIFTSLPGDSFLYSIKISETFWFFTALTCATLMRHGEKRPQMAQRSAENFAHKD